MEPTGSSRRLSAILMADVVGYTRLMQLDQAEAMSRDMCSDWWTEQEDVLRGRIEAGDLFKCFAPRVDIPSAV